MRAPGKISLRISLAVMLTLATAIGSARASTQGAKGLAAQGTLQTAFVTDQSTIVKTKPDGDLGGLAVDLANALAAKLGASMQAVPYDNIVHFDQSIGKNQWDIAIIPRDLSRVRQLAFSKPVLRIELGYVAKSGSNLLSPDDVDRRGIKVAVTEDSAADAYLSRNLTRAKLVRLSPGLSEARQALSFGGADVYAGTVETTAILADQLLGATKLVGYFSSVPIVFAVPKAKADVLPFLNKFIDTAKQDGQIAAFIKQSGVIGVTFR